MALVLDAVQGAGVDGGPARAEQARGEHRGVDGGHIGRQDHPQEGGDPQDRVGHQDQVLVEAGHEDVGDELAHEEGHEGGDGEIGGGALVERVIQVQCQTDGEGPYGRLHAHVEELGEDAHAESPVARQVGQGLPDGGLGLLMAVVEGLAVGELGDGHHDGQDDQHHDDDPVGRQGALQGGLGHLLALQPGQGGQAAVQGLAVSEDEVLAQHRTCQEPQGREGLGDVEPQRRGALGPDHRGVGIGGGLQEGQAHRDGEQGRQEHRVGGHVRGREEQRAAHDVNDQADEQPRLVAGAPDDPRGGDGDEEVAAVEGRLDEGRGEIRQGEDGLELGDEDVVEARGGAPHGEADRQQDVLEHRDAVEVAVGQLGGGVLDEPAGRRVGAGGAAGRGRGAAHDLPPVGARREWPVRRAAVVACDPGEV